MPIRIRLGCKTASLPKVCYICHDVYHECSSLSLIDVDISFAIHIAAIVFLSLIQSMARQNGRACVILAFMTWQVHHFFIPRSNSSHYSNNRNAFSPFFAHYTSSSPPYIHMFFCHPTHIGDHPLFSCRYYIHHH